MDGFFWLRLLTSTSRVLGHVIDRNMPNKFPIQPLELLRN